MKRPSWLAAGLLAGLFLAFHLPFLPSSLEDLDSINFAFGVRDYDVSRHQPHPPGYPIFLLAAKGLHRLGLSEVHSLSLLSVFGGALAIFGCVILFRELDRDRPFGPLTWMAVIIAVTCPLYWTTAARPLSDSAGLAAALAVQALTVTATSTPALALAAACAGLAIGLRSQIAWLTLPLLALALMRQQRVVRLRGVMNAAMAFLAGILVWAVPLVIISGGPAAYWRALFNQGAEDITGVTMLATTHTLSLLTSTLRSTLIDPWGYWQTGAAVLVLSAIGLGVLLARSRFGFVTLICGFGPYFVFHLLFQEAITTRYALPIVVPMAYLAVRGASVMPQMLAMGAAIAITASSVFVDDATLYGYAQMDAPAFRMLGDMHAGAPVPGGDPPVLAMHRKDEFDMRRPMQWVGSDMPRLAEHLPSPPKHEWLELVKYWNNGGRNPVWFVADPLRSDLALVRDARRPTLYRWPFRFVSLVGGARPNEMDWHVIDLPDWYLGEGWSLTPETAGVAKEDRRGPGYAPITGWIRRWDRPTTLMIGGRNLVPGGPPARVRTVVNGSTVDEVTVSPGFFLKMLTVPNQTGSGEYVPVTIESDNQALAIEQFDAQPAGRVIFGFGDGWNELEYNPSTGVQWRWSTDRSLIRVRAEGHAVALTLRGQVEGASSSHVVIRAGDSIAAEFDVGKSFERTVFVPATLVAAPETTIAIESSAWYVPAETRWRSKDQRRLGLKLFECRVTPAS